MWTKFGHKLNPRNDKKLLVTIWDMDGTENTVLFFFCHPMIKPGLNLGLFVSGSSRDIYVRHQQVQKWLGCVPEEM